MAQTWHKWHKLRFKQNSGAALWVIPYLYGARLLDMRPESITRDIAGKNGLTKLGKAAFYYLFKYLGADKGTSF